VAVEGAEIDRQARPTAGQKTSSHGVPASGADRGRLQHIVAASQATIPALDDELRLEARGAVGLELAGASLDVETSRTNSRRDPILFAATVWQFSALPWSRNLRSGKKACRCAARCTNDSWHARSAAQYGGQRSVSGRRAFVLKQVQSRSQKRRKR
jgi:hypothetical protein